MLAPLPISDQFVGAGLAPPAFASRRTLLLCRGVASARPPLLVIPNEVRTSAPSRAFHAMNLLFLQRLARSHSSGQGIAAPPFRRFSIFHFRFSISYKSLHKHGDVRPAEDCADNERDHGDGGQVEQPVTNARIEQRRGIIGVSLMSMKKPVGNVRHSHDNLLAQAPWRRTVRRSRDLSANVLASHAVVQRQPRSPFGSLRSSRRSWAALFRGSWLQPRQKRSRQRGASAPEGRRALAGLHRGGILHLAQERRRIQW
jgi:hypothetical protein